MFRSKKSGPLTGESVSQRQLALDDVENLKVAANKFFTDGKYSQAVIGYSYAIQQLEQVIPPEKRAGVATGPPGPLQAAGKVLAVLHCNRAQCYLKMEKFSKALDDAGAAASADPSSFKAWYRKGVALARLGKYYDSLTALKVAIRLDPGSSEAASLLEEMRYKMGPQANGPPL
eukprot:TRINITY_DN5770_c0_g1_i1.p1 TRINITY_DN5770_c0_g1~~TRINITY_DN5770_c0_g1_i1.p1  ORF type:complete len:174 (-),score=38.40 TRINITY_DN5770_c0_g1_i1:941-1462(-)